MVSTQTTNFAGSLTESTPRQLPDGPRRQLSRVRLVDPLPLAGLRPLAGLIDHVGQLARGLVAAAGQNLQDQVDGAANQAQAAHAGPDAPAGKAHAAPVFDLG